ncbi:MAG: type VI secretion system protein TssL, partial [Pseudomonadota bacterium]
MSDDDPFAEPHDTDKTVIRPNPGGRRPSGGAPQQSPQAFPDPYAQPHGQGQPSYGVPPTDPYSHHDRPDVPDPAGYGVPQPQMNPQ